MGISTSASPSEVLLRHPGVPGRDPAAPRRPWRTRPPRPPRHPSSPGHSVIPALARPLSPHLATPPGVPESFVRAASRPARLPIVRSIVLRTCPEPAEWARCQTGHFRAPRSCLVAQAAVPCGPGCAQPGTRARSPPRPPRRPSRSHRPAFPDPPVLRAPLFVVSPAGFLGGRCRTTPLGTQPSADVFSLPDVKPALSLPDGEWSLTEVLRSLLISGTPLRSSGACRNTNVQRGLTTKASQLGVNFPYSTHAFSRRSKMTPDQTRSTMHAKGSEVHHIVGACNPQNRIIPRRRREADGGLPLFSECEKTLNRGSYPTSYPRRYG